MWMALVAIILTLLLVVGIHEAGHALAARVFKVRIEKISIGFGRPLLQWQGSNGCQWIWAMWPLGGYVALLNSRVSPVDAREYPYCFDKKPIWIRLIILLAGVFANLVTAFIAFVLVYSIGITYKVPQIESIATPSSAAEAGINAGDQFIAINGYATASWQEVGMQLVVLWGSKDVAITLKSANNPALKNVTLNLSQIRFNPRDRSLLASLGIKPNLSAQEGLIRSSSFTGAMQQSYEAAVHQIYFFLMILKKLITGVLPFSILLGPLGLFAASISSLSQGLMVFCYYIASLSLAVALVNLFPIPGLDGGSVFYLVLEKIRGKAISVGMEVLLHRLVFIVFAIMLVQLLVNDLNRYLM